MVLGTELVLPILIVAIAVLEQMVCEGPAVIIGVGLTAMVKVLDAPVQPFSIGVTVIVDMLVTAPLFCALNAGMLPLPVAASPMDGLLLVQMKFVPGILPIKLMAVVLDPAQMV